jgi:hypothetical protein
MGAQDETEHAETGAQRTTVAAPKPLAGQSQPVAPNPPVVSARNRAARAQKAEVVEGDALAVRIAPAPNHAKAWNPGRNAPRVQSHDPTRRVALPANPANPALHVRIAHRAVP